MGRPREGWKVRKRKRFRCYTVRFTHRGFAVELSTGQEDLGAAKQEAARIFDQFEKSGPRYRRPRKLERTKRRELVGLKPPAGPGVYAAGFSGFVKIGRTKNIKKRLEFLDTSCPEPIRLLAILSPDPLSERRFHERFAEERVRGEWFRMSGRLRAALLEARGVSGNSLGEQLKP